MQRSVLYIFTLLCKYYETEKSYSPTNPSFLLYFESSITLK